MWCLVGMHQQIWLYDPSVTDGSYCMQPGIVFAVTIKLLISSPCGGMNLGMLLSDALQSARASTMWSALCPRLEVACLSAANVIQYQPYVHVFCWNATLGSLSETADTIVTLKIGQTK